MLGGVRSFVLVFLGLRVCTDTGLYTHKDLAHTRAHAHFLTKMPSEISTTHQIMEHVPFRVLLFDTNSCIHMYL